MKKKRFPIQSDNCYITGEFCTACGECGYEEVAAGDIVKLKGGQKVVLLNPGIEMWGDYVYRGAVVSRSREVTEESSTNYDIPCSGAYVVHCYLVFPLSEEDIDVKLNEVREDEFVEIKKRVLAYEDPEGDEVEPWTSEQDELFSRSSGIPSTADRKLEEWEDEQGKKTLQALTKPPEE